MDSFHQAETLLSTIEIYTYDVFEGIFCSIKKIKELDLNVQFVAAVKKTHMIIDFESLFE